MSDHADERGIPVHLKAVISFLGLAALLMASPAWSILNNCSASASPVNFGGYNPLGGSPTDSTGNVAVTCQCILSICLVVGYNIQLSTGSNNTYLPRAMVSGANHLNYNLYTNAAHSTIWGNGTSSTVVVSDSFLLGIGTATRNYPVYGRIPAGQNVTAGSYSDTITVTVNY